MISPGWLSILLIAAKTLSRSFLKFSSYWQPVALAKSSRDWMMNLKMYSKERNIFWMGSCVSVVWAMSALCCT